MMKRLKKYYEAMKESNVFFQSDNDGCIILTEERVHFPAWWKYGITSYTEAVSNDKVGFERWLNMCRGRKTPDNAIRALREFGRPEDQEKAFDPAWVERESARKEEIVSEILPKECPFNVGARETLELWNCVEMPWGITTSAREFKQIYIPRFEEFRDLVDQEIALTPDMVTHGKPHPEPFLEGSKLVKAKFGLPENSLMFGIEDAASGIISLIRAGADVIFVIGNAISAAEKKTFAKIHPHIFYLKDYTPFLDEKFLQELIEIVKTL